MKKLILYLLFLLVAIAGYISYIVYGSTTNFNENFKIILVQENQTSKESLAQLLKEKNIISNSFAFEQLGNQMKIWDRIKSGKYKINRGDNLLDIVRMFRNNKQSGINLVINKLRQPEDLAKLIGKSFSTDSATALQTLKSENYLTTINLVTIIKK